MNTIIQEVRRKIIKDNNKNLESLFVDTREISQYITDTKAMLDEIGVILVKQVLEMTDVMIKDSAIRKEIGLQNVQMIPKL